MQAPEPLRQAALQALDLFWAAWVQTTSGGQNQDQPAEVQAPAPTTPRLMGTSPKTPRELLAMAGLPTDHDTVNVFLKRLARFRETHFDCYKENDPMKRGETSYVYFADQVAPVVEAFRATLRSKSA